MNNCLLNFLEKYNFNTNTIGHDLDEDELQTRGIEHLVGKSRKYVADFYTTQIRNSFNGMNFSEKINSLRESIEIRESFTYDYQTLLRMEFLRDYKNISPTIIEEMFEIVYGIDHVIKKQFGKDYSSKIGLFEIKYILKNMKLNKNRDKGFDGLISDMLSDDFFEIAFKLMLIERGNRQITRFGLSDLVFELTTLESVTREATFERVLMNNKFTIDTMYYDLYNCIIEIITEKSVHSFEKIESPLFSEEIVKIQDDFKKMRKILKKIKMKSVKSGGTAKIKCKNMKINKKNKSRKL